MELAALGRRLRTALLRDAVRDDARRVSDLRDAEPPGPETLLDEAEHRAPCVARARPPRSAPTIPTASCSSACSRARLIFLADLARAIRTSTSSVDFIAISRYAPDSGRVRILQDVDLDLAGRDVVLVEDLVDTGLTARVPASSTCGAQDPRRVEVCTLLDRPARRIVPLDGALRRLRRSPTCSCSATGSTWPTCTATSRGSWSPTASVVRASPTPTSPRSTVGDAAEGRRRPVLGWPPVRSGGARDPDVLVGVRVEVPSNQPIVLLRENEGQRVPADLHRAARGDRDRLRAPGHRDAPADDPRPLQDRARRPRGQGRPGRHHRAPRRHLLRRDRDRPRRRAPTGSRRRPSDAIALAVRYGEPVPIFADEDVLEEAGVLFEQDEDEEQIEQFREFLDQVRPEDFAHGTE